MYEISVESSFSAAHRLRDYQGPCENLHGHNWLVRASVRCETLDACGLGIAQYIYEKLESALAGWNGSIARVEVFETPGCCAAYYK
jgi:6-pyruvoyltetrahydropterin/6-carboxytetrahydropterin synthase